MLYNETNDEGQFKNNRDERPRRKLDELRRTKDSSEIQSGKRTIENAADGIYECEDEGTFVVALRLLTSWKASEIACRV